jgi:hypothetical protein
MRQQRYNGAMADFTIALSIPQHMIDQLRRLARARGLPVEQVILQLLEASLVEAPLPPSVQAELDALTHLSNEALWTIAHEQMDLDQQEQMQLLRKRSRLNTITEPERTALIQLEDQGQRLTLRKSKAMALLIERGHTVPLVDGS